MVVEDEEGLRAVEVELGFGDVLAEVSDVEGGVGAAGTVAFGVKADEHVHGELKLVLRWAAVPFFEFGGVGEVGLADEDSVAGVLVDHGAHAADDVVDLGEEVGVDVFVVGVALGVGAGEDGLVAELGIFKEGGDGVETKAGDAAVEPELHGAKHGFFDSRVAPVEVGLLLVELVIVELVDGGLPLPGGAAEEGDPVVGRDAAFVFVGGFAVGGAGLAVAPDVPVVFWVGAGAGGVDEPLVLVGGVVEDHVEDDADLPIFSFGYDAVEVGEGSVLGIDCFVVGDIVAEVDLGGRVHWGDPDGVDAKGLEVVQALSDAVEITDAVTVGVLEAAGADLVD